MKKLILAFAFGLLGFFSASAQKGQIWSTLTRQNFESNENNEWTATGDAVNYYTYYIFISNNEIIHVTPDITSLYKINSRKSGEGFMDYEVISEVGNVYTFRMHETEKYVTIISTTANFGVYISTMEPYNTSVFDNMNK